VIIDSLGNTALSWVPGVRSIRIHSDPVQGTALMDVCLYQSTWQAREAAIEKLVELRCTFLEDLALEYRFVDSDDCGSVAPQDETRVFAPA
jgi:hypothetical protein